jgi:serine/threonine protein kinase
MPAPPSIDRQTFLTYLRQSGLVENQDVDNLAKQYANISRTRTLARKLVEDGILTRFQAERLLMGRTAGFQLGQYRILEQIGRGGMGRVYRAEHRTMRRQVAIKVLAPELLSTDRAIELFLHEVRAIAQVQHPNIVTAYDANELNGRYYLVLEFVDGPNLDQLVRQQGPLPVGLACDYIRQAALGLQCAHQLGMVHRDIKPANLLVQLRGQSDPTSPGLVKVSDFGLARLGQPQSDYHGLEPRSTIMTRDNTVMGTPDYLSPEQSRSLRKTDIRSDLYSLGCTFRFLLTGQVPFPGGTALEKIIRHATEAPLPISAFRSDVPPEVEKIVTRLMAKHPDERFATPSELVEALRPYAVSSPTPWAKPVSSDEVLVDAPEANDVELAALPNGSDPAQIADASNDELSVFNPTMPALSMTVRPISPSGIYHHRHDRTTYRRIQLAILSATLFVGILLGLALLAGLMNR